jgi:hypothetical protein
MFNSDNKGHFFLFIIDNSNVIRVKCIQDDNFPLMRFRDFWLSFNAKNKYKISHFKTHKPLLYNTELKVKLEILFNSDTLSEELNGWVLF